MLSAGSERCKCRLNMSELQLGSFLCQKWSSVRNPERRAGSWKEPCHHESFYVIGTLLTRNPVKRPTK